MKITIDTNRKTVMISGGCTLREMIEVLKKIEFMDFTVLADIQPMTIEDPYIGTVVNHT